MVYYQKHVLVYIYKKNRLLATIKKNVHVLFVICKSINLVQTSQNEYMLPPGGGKTAYIV